MSNFKLKHDMTFENTENWLLVEFIEFFLLRNKKKILLKAKQILSEMLKKFLEKSWLVKSL